MAKYIIKNNNTYFRAFFESFGVFLATVCIMLIVHSLVALLAFVITQSTSSPEQLFIERLYPLLAAAVLIAWTRKKRKGIYNRIIDATKYSKNNILNFAKYALLSAFILYTAFIISIWGGYSKFVHSGLVDFSQYAILKQYILVWLIGNLFVVIGEEIIFRGFLLNYIIGISRSQIFGLFFTSFVFSLHYYPDFLNNVIAFLAGLSTAYAYLKFRTLYIPMGIHFAYNVFNASIASESSRGPQLPYLVKMDYSMIREGLGAWVDLFIIAGFVVIILALLLTNTSSTGYKALKDELSLSMMRSGSKIN